VKFILNELTNEISRAVAAHTTKYMVKAQEKEYRPWIDNKLTQVVKENIIGSDNRHTTIEISKYGRTVTDPTDMANSFNKYSSKIAESISNALPSVPDEQPYTTDSHLNTTNH
jgi:hypothetical protein